MVKVKFESHKYAQYDTSDQMVDLYWNPDSACPRPVVLWIHGGAWRRGDKHNIDDAKPLLEAGYAVAAISYRFSSEALFPAQIIDCKTAVRRLRAKAPAFGLNPDRIFAWGASAGAHLAALLGTASARDEWEQGDHLEYSSRVQAVCTWYAPVNFLTMDDKNITIDHRAAESPESELLGGPIEQRRDAVRSANPTTYIDEETPPFLVMHGEADRLVPPNQSRELVAGLESAGVVVHSVFRRDLGHGGPGWRELVPQVFAFFDGIGGEGAQPTSPPPPRRKRWTYRYTSIPEEVTCRRFYAPTIGRDYLYSVALPPGFPHDEPYPVLYWLPGRRGDPAAAWPVMGRTRAAISRGTIPPMLIVGVSGVDSSMYCNDANRDFPVEDVLMRDLFPHIERGYGVGDGPEWRFLEGFSMGGYGAARLAMLYPDHFSAVSILSAAMHRPEFLRDERPDIFRRVFGGDLEYAKATSPWTITEERLREAAPLPRLRIVVGDADPLLDKNREYHRLLSEFGREHCFVEVPGVGHSSRDLYDRFPGNPLEFFRVLPNGG